MGMLLLFSNCKPYTNGSDDALAQFCQISLTFALAIGLLEKASDYFQDDVYGESLLPTCTSFLLYKCVTGSSTPILVPLLSISVQRLP